MIARHRRDLEPGDSVQTILRRVIREIRDGLGPHELYFAAVIAWSIAHQGFIGTFTGALHCWSMGCTDRQLTWCVPILIARNVQPALRGTNDVGKRVSYRQAAYRGCSMSG